MKKTEKKKSKKISDQHKKFNKAKRTVEEKMLELNALFPPTIVRNDSNTDMEEIGLELFFLKECVSDIDGTLEGINASLIELNQHMIELIRKK